MKVYGLLNIYNDRTFLTACLESLIDNVDCLVVADGAYREYYQHYKMFDAQARPWSTDGSLEIIKSFRGLPDLTLIKPPIPEPNAGIEGDCWDNQTVKRTILVDAVPAGDWFIIIDADEMLSGDVQEGMEEIIDSGCIVGNTPIYNPGTSVDRLIPKWHPRVFKKKEGMHYQGTHWQLRDKWDRIIETKYPVSFTDRFAFTHFKGFKPQTRLIPHQNYMVSLADRGWLEVKNTLESGEGLYAEPVEK